MIRILQCVNNMHRAGLETMLMNYYRHIDRTKIQFDFLTHRPERADYDDEIERLGGKVYYAPRLYPQNYAAYFSFMTKFFQEHPEYQIMHSHIDAMSYLPLLAGKRAGVPVRIAHSHSTSIDRDLKYPIKLLFRNRLLTAANACCACGQAAGEFLFRGHAYTMIPNAVEAEKFRFDIRARELQRREMQLEGKLVVGHIGRLSYPKNHKFLLEIFAALRKIQPDAVLLLIGSGEYEERLKAQAQRLDIADQVRFMGSQEDVAPFYQAMDVFVMPSLFEGVPVTGIEAQFAQLPCIFSDRVPREVEFTGRCSFVPLSEPADAWAQWILAAAEQERSGEAVANSRFDIHLAAQLLTEYYMQLQERIDGERRLHAGL